MKRSLTTLPVAVAFALIVGLASMTSAPRAQAITTPEILQSSMSTQCLDYQVIGMCAWLYCSAWGCTVRTSIRVKHYIPELVVSAYENTGDNPWTEIAMLSPPTGDALARMLHRAGQTLPDLRLGEDIGATGLRLAIS